MEVGINVELGPWQVRRTWGGNYRLGHSGTGTSIYLYAQWPALLSLARWIVEQEKGRWLDLANRILEEEARPG